MDTDDHNRERRNPIGRRVGMGDENPAPALNPNDLIAADAEIARLRADLMTVEARERALTDKLQHRVRNMLAMIRSVVRQSWEDGGSQEEFAQHLQGRLDAIARYQSHLSGAKIAGIDLEDVIRDELLPTLCLDGPRCTITGPAVRLYDRQADLIGLSIHELATNAIKFGAFAASGRLAVEWSIGDDRRLHFRWRESGVAVAAAAPRRSGFGRRLLEDALPYQLDGTTSFELKPGGVDCSILLRLPNASLPSVAGNTTSTDEPAFLSDDAEQPS